MIFRLSEPSASQLLLEKKEGGGGTLLGRRIGDERPVRARSRRRRSDTLSGRQHRPQRPPSAFGYFCRFSLTTSANGSVGSKKKRRSAASREQQDRTAVPANLPRRVGWCGPKSPTQLPSLVLCRWYHFGELKNDAVELWIRCRHSVLIGLAIKLFLSGLRPALPIQVSPQE